MDYTLETIIATRGDCKDQIDGTICIAVTEYKWLLGQVEKLEQYKIQYDLLEKVLLNKRGD